MYPRGSGGQVAEPVSERAMLEGRVIKSGKASGEALVSHEPLSFLGGVNPETGVVVEPGHELKGRSIVGKILVFPTGKGSTVGSFTIYRLARAGLGPAGIINVESESIVAVGAIISDIPMVDQIDIGVIRSGDHVSINGGQVIVERVSLS
jgi:predicted aconitase with swiveling domain